MTTKIIFIILIAGALGFLFAVKKPIPFNRSGSSSQNLPIAAALPKNIEPKTDSQGKVEITIVPKGLLESSGSSWDFEILLDTHSVELNYDLAKIAELRDDKGNIYKPISWQGGRGGHHISGILSFKPINPLPRSIELIIKTIGEIQERKFNWSF